VRSRKACITGEVAVAVGGRAVAACCTAVDVGDAGIAGARTTDHARSVACGIGAPVVRRRTRRTRNVLTTVSDSVVTVRDASGKRRSVALYAVCKDEQLQVAIGLFNFDPFNRGRTDAISAELDSHAVQSHPLIISIVSTIISSVAIIIANC